MQIRRLPLLLAALATSAVLTGCTPSPASPLPVTSSAATAATTQPPADTARSDFRRLEQRYGARLGVEAIDTGTGRRVSHRADERFAFASTNKTFIAAAVLQSATTRDLDTVVRYGEEDLLDHAPIATRHVRDGMTVRALIDAALRTSDNTAANLLVERLGGPAAVQRFLRSIGDRTTSVDRVEPDLNTAVPGDRRDTTTPAAFARDLRSVLLGRALPDADRALLARTMRANTTGGPHIRAGVPAGWTVEDKTGSGSFGTRNDIAVIRPPGRAPIVLVLLTARTAEDADSQDALLADATRLAMRALG